MGTLVGHVVPGFAFLVIGLWHLLNHIKLHAKSPKHYISLPWFPTSRLRYLELFWFIGVSTISITMELFISYPLDTDLTIPSNHLHTFEHFNMFLAFILYAAFAIILDKVAPKESRYSLTQLLGAAAFGQLLLLLLLHSTDHMGVEGQYHLLLQLVTSLSVITSLMGIGYPKSFLISFVRSLSISFQGVWLLVIGFMLYTPRFIPKGCFLNLEELGKVVRCHDHEALKRAKSLVNIQFSWYLILAITSSMCLYLYLIKIYGEKVEYQTLLSSKYAEEGQDIEAQKKSKLRESKSFVQVGKGFAPMDIEK